METTAEKPAPRVKVSHALVTTIEGPLGAVMAHECPALPDLQEILGTLATLALAVSLTPELRENATAQKATQRAHAILEALGGA